MDVLVVRGGGESGGFVLRILSGGVVWRALAGFGVLGAGETPSSHVAK